MGNGYRKCNRKKKIYNFKRYNKLYKYNIGKDKQ